MVPCQKISQCYGPCYQVNWGENYVNRYRKFDKIQRIFLTAVSKIRLQGNVVSLIKDIYEKAIGYCRTFDTWPVSVHAFIWRPRVGAPARGIVLCGGALTLQQWRTGSVVVPCELICSQACGILIPQPGIEPLLPALQGRFATTAPPAKSLDTLPLKSKSGLRQSCLPSVLPLEIISVLADATRKRQTWDSNLC